MQVRPCGMAERPVVAMKPGNAGGAKGPWFQGADEAARNEAIDDESSNAGKCSDAATEALPEGQARAT